jgi:aminoglycoside phosphotransferase (APT) family kinase protein
VNTPAREYSQRLGRLTTEQLQAALDRFDLGTLIKAEPIPFGLFGQNIVLNTGRGRYILRGRSHYPWQFPKERFFADLVHERSNAPVPWPYLVETSTDIFGWDFAIMPALPGIRLADHEVRREIPRADQRAIARALGEALAELHGVEWPFPGQYDLASNTILPIAISYADWVSAQVHDLGNRACANNVDATTNADLAWVESFIEEAREALQAPFTPVAVHSDFAYNNALAQRIENGWRTSGIVDLMGMYMGDGEADLSLMSRMYVVDGLPDCAEAYLRGYLERCPPRPLFLPRFRLHVLRYILIGWEYGQRNPELGWFQPEETLRSWSEPVVDETMRVASHVIGSMLAC